MYSLQSLTNQLGRKKEYEIEFELAHVFDERLCTFSLKTSHQTLAVASSVLPAVSHTHPVASAHDRMCAIPSAQLLYSDPRVE